jgi:hypothetical protein
MRNVRTRVTIATAIACLGFSLIPTSATAHGRHTIRRYTLSHHHPKTGSVLCAGFVVNTGHGVTVRVISGPAPVKGSPVSGFARGDGSRTLVGIASFGLSEPGLYTVRTVLKSRRGRVLKSVTKSYEVPDGEPLVGPIECPDPANDSFPE